MTPEDHLLDCIREARRKLGADQPIFIRKGITFDHRLVEVAGARYPLGVISPYYLRDGSIELCSARLLVCQDELADDYANLAQIMQQVSQDNQALVVAAPLIGGDVASMFVINHTRETMAVVGLHGPERPAAHDNLKDLCALTGATMARADQPITEQHLGHVDRLWANQHDTMIWNASAAEATHARGMQLSVGGCSPAEIEHLLACALSTV